MSQDIGYYAPEQKESLDSILARSATTDMYMIGMVIFFMFTGEPPPEGGAVTQEWEQLVDQKISSAEDHEQLAATRLARVIKRATRIDIGERISSYEAREEIEVIGDIYHGRLEKWPTEAFVENIARSVGREYFWIDEASKAEVRSTGIQILSIESSKNDYHLMISYGRRRSDSDDRGQFGRRQREKIDQAVKQFIDAGWVEMSRQSGANEAMLEVRREVKDHREAVDKDITKIVRIVDRLLLD